MATLSFITPRLFFFFFFFHTRALFTFTHILRLFKCNRALKTTCQNGEKSLRHRQYDTYKCPIHMRGTHVALCSDPKWIQKRQLSELVSMDNLPFDLWKESRPSEKAFFCQRDHCLHSRQLTNFLYDGLSLFSALGPMLETYSDTRGGESRGSECVEEKRFIDNLN